jgi:hypothetical protein
MKEPPACLGTPLKKIIFGSLDEYARELFSKLREFESCGDIIIAQLPDEENIGFAIRNRLQRAACAGRKDFISDTF